MFWICMGRCRCAICNCEYERAVCGDSIVPHVSVSIHAAMNVHRKLKLVVPFSSPFPPHSLSSSYTVLSPSFALIHAFRYQRTPKAPHLKRTQSVRRTCIACRPPVLRNERDEDPHSHSSLDFDDGGYQNLSKMGIMIWRWMNRRQTMYWAERLECWRRRAFSPWIS